MKTYLSITCPAVLVCRVFLMICLNEDAAVVCFYFQEDTDIRNNV